jgi:hypothetical protein
MAKQTDEVVVHVNRKGTLTVPGLGTLRPGANKVSREALELMKQKTTAPDGTSSIPGKVLSIDEDAPAGTVGRKADQAISLVKDTFDVELLGEWLEQDDRATVRKAINDQIELLLKEPEEDGEDDAPPPPADGE